MTGTARFPFDEARPAHPLPGERDTHIWTIELDVPRPILEQLEAVLSDDERDRAARFRFDLHRRRFVTGHAALRLLFADYLGISPADARFGEEAAGKPVLLNARGTRPLQFNLSHSDGLALVAVTSAAPVGVDIELVRDVPEAVQIAGRWFSPRERDAFHRAPDGQKARLFTTIWTRKEAYVKALGEGLQDSLHTFDVSPEAGDPAAVLTLRDGQWQPAEWVIYPLMIDPGFGAALALPGWGWRISCRAIRPGQYQPP